MVTATQIDTHVTKQPGVCGGKAAIDQTRVSVNNVICIVRDGGAVEDVIVAYPQLTLAQVHAALAYSSQRALSRCRVSSSRTTRLSVCSHVDLFPATCSRRASLMSVW